VNIFLQEFTHKQSSRTAVTAVTDRLKTRAWWGTSYGKLGSWFFDTCLLVLVGKNTDTDTDTNTDFKKYQKYRIPIPT